MSPVVQESVTESKPGKRSCYRGESEGLGSSPPPAGRGSRSARTAELIAVLSTLLALAWSLLAQQQRSASTQRSRSGPRNVSLEPAPYAVTAVRGARYGYCYCTNSSSELLRTVFIVGSSSAFGGSSHITHTDITVIFRWFWSYPPRSADSSKGIGTADQETVIRRQQG